jgi:type IV pilus assembly protein PilB
MAEEHQAKIADALIKRDLITQEEYDQVKEHEERSGTPWYRQLLQRGKISFGPLEDILRTEFHSPSTYAAEHSLGQTLVDLKAITQEQLEEALAEQNRNGRLLGNILLDRGLVTQRTRALALAKQQGLEFADIDETDSDTEALMLVDKHLALKHHLIPVAVEGDRITVLINDPQVRETIGSVGILLNKRIHPVLTNAENIKQEIQARYAELKEPGGKKTKSKKAAKETEEKETKKNTKRSKQREEETPVTTETTTDKPIPAEKKERFEEIQRLAQGAPVIKLVSTIIEGAANSGATDVHLDPQDPEMRVRYRIDGVLHDVMSISPDIENAVISRIKILSDLDITETRRPQDGHISLEIGDREYDVRVATLPTYLGERVVLRMLDQSSVLQGIKDLGMESDDVSRFLRILDQPYGMILVTGPTGSGKTTTLYGALNQKNVMTESIVTLEDPVEYQLSGINQVQIDPDIDLTFANTLRAALRQDIDVLLVGEIRDADTARIAIRAAMTGHLVFSTLHTNDAPEAISTLRNMGIPSYLIASALTSVLAQRLVRCICPDCKKGFTPTKQLLKSLHLPESTKKLYRGEGCDQCFHTGNRGRTGIFEVLEISGPIRKMIGEDEATDKIMKTAKLKTMSDRCRQKVKDGIVAPEEFLRVIRT